MHTLSKPITTISWFRRHKLFGTSLFAVVIVSLYQTQKYYRNEFNGQRQETKEKENSLFFPVMNSKNQKVGVNEEFKRQLSLIAKIIFPHWRTKEGGLLVLHSIFLVLRTYLSVVVARLDGRIVRDLVNGHGKRFLIGLVYWFAIAIPATYTNSMIRYLQSKLSIGFRTRLTKHIHDIYLDQEKTFYKVINLDNRIQGADQFITTDIAKFCDTLSSLYSNLAKPILDTIIFNYQLTKSIGLVGMVGLSINYIITARLLRAVTPSFGKLAAIEAKLEGDFRAAHSRIITNAEEIAFYNGAELEHSILNKAYLKLIKHINSIYKLRISYNMFEDFLIKYAWSAFGLVMCAIPVFTPQLTSTSTTITQGDENIMVGARTKGFITNKRLMMSLADAGGRMMYSYKELAELAGYTSRVYNLISVLHALHNNQFDNGDGVESNKKPYYTLTNINGRVVIHDSIQFEHVPIVAPAPGGRVGEVLVNDLNVQIHPGEHLLVTGPNGVGKTAVARIIASLWPVFEGTLTKPSDHDIFYIPQRPYLSLGTLRDQIIYPHSKEDMIKAGHSDMELLEILEIVHLAYIPDREGGLETVKEWKDVFSGGEKQRIGMARLFYHHPKFAVLDECTSAVSTDVEGLMYSHAKDIGITLLTISHRPALFKYHRFLLRLTGNNGKWEWETIGTREQLQSVEKELCSLQAKLQEVNTLKARLATIDQELSLKL
ncbi:ABC transporter transmembrane region 2-domain-containing protein [Cokeromyces recurvatus]|uniref:ABC transporter transmembrane region 2-domain-containing protein n=1 Tax=Cokeromyces recurvatus TaxID=90255 RepID=UPI0022205206|nr:ABC transporter transmembrane region 2-domain-containing protein [Cokeromyces recurvatus]KAI7903074.1 ABC transporter transmembrane region 2-domain-containing protein [Cokeromyces recurvatus]